MDDFKLKVHHVLKEDDIKNLPVISDEDFVDVVSLMFLNDYRHIPELIRLPDLNRNLADKLGLEKDSFFVLKRRSAHIRPSRKGAYDQVLSFDEYCAIPKIVREAAFAIVDKVHSNFQLVFDDMDGDLKKINKIVFNKDNFGNYLVTVGKVDREFAFSEKINTVVGVGFAPTIQVLRFPAGLPVTRFRESPTTDKNIVSDSIEKSSDISFAEKKAGYYSVMAEKEQDELVKKRYEEKAFYWRKIADGKPVSADEEARCGPDHRKDAVDNIIHWRHCLEKSTNPVDAAEFQRRVEYWRKAAVQEKQAEELVKKADALVKALAERDLDLSFGIDSDDWCD